VFRSLGATILLSPIQAPQANSITERWIGSCRPECLDNILIYNAHHAEQILSEYTAHHNTARPHRSLRQLAPRDAGEPDPAHPNTKIIRIDRLGGTIHEYTQLRPCA
jgi:putative transposase